MDGVSIISLNGHTPRIDPSAFIAPGCRIIGDVEIGPEASVWYNCVLRGDVNAIRIGVHAIGQRHARHSHHPFQEKRIERNGVFLGQRGVDRIKLSSIIFTHIGWGQHADKEHFDIALL